jgi:hypothetical protein
LLAEDLEASGQGRAGDVAAGGLRRLATGPSPTGAFESIVTIGIVRAAFLAASAAEVAGRDEQIDLAPGPAGGERRKPIDVAIGPAVSIVDPAELAQCVQERIERVLDRCAGRCAQVADRADLLRRLRPAGQWSGHARQRAKRAGGE